ncbi:MAG: hypothetical protein GWN29_08495 [Gammaproteobacteria bacterium]|nr:hypothetical protein [Gammaproteobacteria bacterium]
MSPDRIAGIGALVLGVVLYALAGESEAYLFPRSIALAVGMLGLVIAGSTWTQLLRPAQTMLSVGRAWLKVLPALAVFIAYRLTMESIGFYVSAFAAFSLIVWIYAPEPVSSRAAAKRLGISAAFIAAIYVLFSVLLNVQTPRGLLL